MENQSPVIVEPVVNEKMPDAEVLKALDEYCHGLAKVTSTMDRVRQLVGRLLVEVRSRRLYEKKGYKSFNEFLLKEIEEKYGLSRATSYNAISVAVALPDLSLDQAERVGYMRLALVVQVIKRHDDKPESEKKRLEAKLLNRAEKMSVVKFRSSLEKDGLLNSDSAGQKLVIAIKANRKLMALWKKMVGDDDPADVLWRLLKGVRVKAAPHFKKAA